MLPTKFRFILLSDFRGDDIFFLINQPEIRMVLVGRLFTDLNKMSNLNRRPSIDASYQVSVHLAKQFSRRFLEIDQPETITACASRFQRRRFLEINQSAIRIACGGNVC